MRQQDTNSNPASKGRRKLLILHGARQVGQLLVGRMDKLRKKLQKGYNIGLIAPDGPFPHPDDKEMRQWWIRDGNEYQGLDETLELIQSLWNDNPELEGILGFSQGARLAHLLVQCHESKDHPMHLDGLNYVIMCAGYDAPIPTNLLGISPPGAGETGATTLKTRSLHVFGAVDKLIRPAQSRNVMPFYSEAIAHEHDGGHHVPMRAANVEAYLTFIANNMTHTTRTATVISPNQPPPISTTQKTVFTPSLSTEVPDEDAMMAQQDEVEALSAIYPDEFKLLSGKRHEDQYEFPISYRMDLPASDEGVWPPHPLALEISYPHNYPAEAMPNIKFVHANNMMQFSSGQMNACMKSVTDAGEAEMGMPSVLSCIYAARDFFESGAMANVQPSDAAAVVVVEGADEDHVEEENTVQENGQGDQGGFLQKSSSDRIRKCNLEGLDIARKLLSQGRKSMSIASTPVSTTSTSHGGTWKYTLGLVGKPSAGKSTFFNAATAFARQRNDTDNTIGGATMAPHPFTTIDPNIGFCLIPAPAGSCPEDNVMDETIGCTHGRDHLGRRLIPVMLKDVAGLVPGAYQGRGRGNKFLNDLTDADVLIHVLDASGTADTEGNTVGTENESGGSHPLEDLAWILNELIEWVFNNVAFKWESIRRRGRNKLSDMFSGYGQSQAVTHEVLLAVERYMEESEHRDRPLDHLEEWDEADLHRLVSAFLGVRFPMALALNKKDLPSAKVFVEDVKKALPVHGAHVGVPLSARSEMTFVRQHILLQESIKSSVTTPTSRTTASSRPEGVWQCLQSAMTLKEPILVFPVQDMVTYAPLPGMLRHALEDASLPSAGMISCLVAAGGSAPSHWQYNHDNHNATATTRTGIYSGTLQQQQQQQQSTGTNHYKLRDVLLMKPGSTVEDVFFSLKRMGALGGEFVRAEGVGHMGQKPKLVPKHDMVHPSNRILKIMTNKRSQWQ